MREYHLPTRMALFLERNKEGESLTQYVKDAEISEPLDTIKWCSCYRKWHGKSSKKITTKLLYDPAIPLLGIHPKESKQGLT